MTCVSVALGDYPHFRPLKDGSVQSEVLQVTAAECPSLLLAIRQMCRNLTFEVCEMPVITYLVGREAGLPVTAIPVFPLRQPPQRQLVSSQFVLPQQLAGRRVGVRTYTATSGVWVRGLLATEYGVDCDAITWVTVDEEHIDTFRPPRNVSERLGEDLQALLLGGEVDAAIGVPSSPPISLVIPDAAAAEHRWRERTGLYPINHTVVVRNDVLEAHPSAAKDLFDLFEEARICSGADPAFTYGIPSNEHTLATLIGFAHEQHILRRAWEPEEMFA